MRVRYILFSLMKYLGIDVGKKQVGIAVSDDGGSVAFPLERVDRVACVDRVLALVDERDVQSVVLGESVNLDGSANPVMEDVREIADALRQRGVAVSLEPEQFSTQAAQRLGQGNDAEAAAVILQSHLDKQNTDRKEDIDFG